MDGERGLTLLEVVIALLLFSMMAMFLLSGQARAADSILRAQIEREMAELLRLRLDLAALEYEEYREGTTDGDFPSDVSSRIIDEDEILGDRFVGYRWEVTVTETIGAGAASTIEIEGGDSTTSSSPRRARRWRRTTARRLRASRRRRSTA